MVEGNPVEQGLQFYYFVCKMEGAQTVSHDLLDLCPGGIAFLAPGKPHEAFNDIIGEDKLEALAEVVDLVSDKHVGRIFRLLLHYWQFLRPLYSFLELIFATADLKIYVGKLIFYCIKFLVVEFDRFFEVNDCFLDGNLHLSLGRVGQLRKFGFLTLLELFLVRLTLDSLNLFLMLFVFFLIFGDGFDLVLVVRVLLFLVVHVVEVVLLLHFEHLALHLFCGSNLRCFEDCWLLDGLSRITRGDRMLFRGSIGSM